MPLVDFELECDAGTIYIGSTSRFWVLLTCCIFVIGACYLCERWRKPNLGDERAHESLLLSGSAKYFFALENWKYKNCIFLNRASAVITGLLSVKRGDTIYVVDIKLWRVLSLQTDLQVPPHHPLFERAKVALPLASNNIAGEVCCCLDKTKRHHVARWWPPEATNYAP
ncbi:Aste57867_16219 [Aphanomyces stellatus]|uniref:Aste57867_16219 protein n=1 Tax=Aphanomyces stellatus TaxID=120398 RepID=A0A485L546_9STRA|nr:hypothetical protein As57867_016162 [Aphanomyces stellatus]VFT92997.1 Aste57867_16219 [Aphanomyces stellatus]